MDLAMTAVHKTTVEQIQIVVKQSRDMTAPSVNMQLSKMNGKGNAEFKAMEERPVAMEERHLAVEARLATLEDFSSSSTRIHNARGSPQEQEGQRTTRALAAGFHKDTCKEETSEFLRQVLQEAGMEMEKMDIRCPAKPITHAFLQFASTYDRNKFIRSANHQNCSMKGRNIRFTSDKDAKER